MIKIVDEFNTKPKIPLQIKLALEELSNKLGRKFCFRWSSNKYFGTSQLMIDYQYFYFRNDFIDKSTNKDIFDLLYNEFKETKDTWDEMLFKNENEQAFYDAARDWEYIV